MKCKYCNKKIRPHNKTGYCRKCQEGKCKSCIDCNTLIKYHATRCRSCHTKNRHAIDSNVGFRHKRHTVESKEKIRHATSGEYNHFYGKSHSKKSRIQMSLNQGGDGVLITRKKYYYGKEWNENLKEVIRDRDNRVCQLCFKPEDKKYKRLDIHHIDYNKMNCQEANLISLCHSCHMKTTHNRTYYSLKFQKIIKG